MFKYYGKTAPYLFLLPAGIVLLIFFFIPFFQTIGLSFFDYANNIYSPNFAGLKNYIEITYILECVYLVLEYYLILVMIWTQILFETYLEVMLQKLLL